MKTVFIVKCSGMTRMEDRRHSSRQTAVGDACGEGTVTPAKTEGGVLLKNINEGSNPAL